MVNNYNTGEVSVTYNVKVSVSPMTARTWSSNKTSETLTGRETNLVGGEREPSVESDRYGMVNSKDCGNETQEYSFEQHVRSG